MLFRLFKAILRFANIVASIALLISYTSSFVPPQEFWYIQLFGLVYPALLITVVVITIINFAFTRKFTFPMLVLLVGAFTHAKYFGVDFKTPELSEHSKNKVSVMSFNARMFDAYKFVTPELIDSRGDFIELFKSEPVDILCIQEYAVDETNKSMISPEEIKKAGEYVDYVTTMTLEKKKMFLGQAIYSKHPIINAENIGDASASIPSIFADIVKGKDTIRVYNFHLESIRFQKDEYSLFDTEVESSKSYSDRIKGLISKLKKAYPLRTKQAQIIIDHALTSPYPVIINGDLNDPPTSYVYSMMNKQFKDAYNEASFGMARTYAGKVPAGRIDYIFYNDGLTPLSFRTWKEKVLSDHYPIISEFVIR